MNWIIRDETASDIEAISGITRIAFENHPYGHNTEQFIIRALRAAGAASGQDKQDEHGKQVRPTVRDHEILPSALRRGKCTQINGIHVLVISL